MQRLEVSGAVRPPIGVVRRQRVNDLRQTGLHTAKPLEPEPSVVDCEMAIEEHKSYK